MTQIDSSQNIIQCDCAALAVDLCATRQPANKLRSSNKQSRQGLTFLAFTEVTAEM